MELNLTQWVNDTDEDYVDIAPTDVDYDNMTPEGKHTLQTAIEIFGGKIIPEDNK